MSAVEAVEAVGDGPPRARAGLRRVVDRIEAESRLDQVATPVRQLATRLVGPPAVRDLLSGVPLGHPAHPLAVTAPIGLWAGGGLLDLAGQRRAARTLIGAGVLAALPSVLTGLSDWLDTADAEQRVGVVHAACNTVATTAFGASWLRRRTGHGGGASAAVGALALAGAGWLGGHLAYAMGVGVDTNAFETGPADWTPVASLEPCGDGLQRGTADGVQVVVIERAAGTDVLADRCSHRGGPLSEGRLDGTCLQCPWHGSRFDTRTGDVLAGPATLPQPAYDVRRVDGALEIRRDERRALRRNTVRPGRRS